MTKQHRILLGAIALALMSLTGCTTLSGPRPGPDAPGNDPGVQAIQSAGDLGALGCGFLAIELEPGDLAKARTATAAARAVLLQPTPSIQALTAALTEADLPPRYTVLGAVALQRIRVRLGQADVIPVDSVAFGMAEQFLDACGLALDALPNAALDLPLLGGSPVG